MNVELQIRSSALASITANAVQTQLRTTCFASLGSAYIDHADVAVTPVEVFPANERFGFESQWTSSLCNGRLCWLRQTPLPPEPQPWPAPCFFCSKCRWQERCCR